MMKISRSRHLDGIGMEMLLLLLLVVPNGGPFNIGIIYD